MLNQPQLQSSLGEVTKTKTTADRVWNMGSLALGVVTKVHTKRYTADVRIYGTNDKFTSGHDKEGRYACRIGVGNAGYDEEFKRAYGEIVPIRKGAIVLVGFLQNNKDRPVILRVFHNTSEDNDVNNFNNILDSLYNTKGERLVDCLVKISPIQDFMYLNRDGDLEIASHTKSFMVATQRELDFENYDFEDLSLKDEDNKTVTMNEKYSARPLKAMLSFRSSFTDSVTNWLKIMVDSAKTSFRVARLQQAENKSTIIEITEKGDINLRRQLDTKSFEGSKKYTEVSINSDGTIDIQVSGDKLTKLKIDGSGVSLDTTSSVKLSSEEDITLKSETLNANHTNIVFNGHMTLNSKRVAVQGDSTSDGATIS